MMGRSAGALAGAQLTSGIGGADLYRARCAPPEAAVSATMGRALMLRYGLAVFTPGTAARARKRLGRGARASPPLSDAERQAVIVAWLPTHARPPPRAPMAAVAPAHGPRPPLDSAS